MAENAIDKLQGLSTETELRNEILFKELCTQINGLLQHDFEKLVYILYRVDVDEQKLKKMLEYNSDIPSAEVIANLLVERQAAKIKTRQQYRQNQVNDDEERW